MQAHMCAATYLGMCPVLWLWPMLSLVQTAPVSYYGETSRPQGGRNCVLGPAVQGSPQTWFFSWELEELGTQHLCAYSVKKEE